MKFNKIYKNTLVASSVVISAALITGCSVKGDEGTEGLFFNHLVELVII